MKLTSEMTRAEVEAEVKRDVAWCETKKAMYPEYAKMYDKWIADHKARLDRCKQ